MQTKFVSRRIGFVAWLVAMSTSATAVAQPRQNHRATDRPEPAAIRNDLYGDSLPAKSRTRLGTVRLRYGRCFAFSPDGKILATVEYRTLYLWETLTGKELHRFPLQMKTTCKALHFSPDGRKLAAVDFTGAATEVWDAKQGKCLFFAPNAGSGGTIQESTIIAFSLDGKILWVGDCHTIRGVDSTTGKERVTFEHTKPSNDSGVNTIVFSPDGKLVFTGPRAGGHRLKVWNTQERRLMYALPGLDQENGVYCAAFSRDASLLATGNFDDKVRVWDVRSGKEAIKFSLEGRPFTWKDLISLAFTPDNKFLAAASSDSTIRLWDLGDQDKPPRIIRAPEVSSLAFSPDGKMLGWVCCYKTVRLLDWAADKEINSVAGHQGEVTAVVFSADGKRLVSGSADHTIRIWDVNTGKQLRVMSGHKGSVYALALSPDNRWLASGSGDYSVALWNMDSEKVRFMDGKHVDEVRAVAFSPDGKTLASAGHDHQINLWELASGKRLGKLHENSASAALSFSPNGRILVSGGSGSVRFYELAGTQFLCKRDIDETVTALAFSSDGKTVVVESKKKTIFWEMATNKERACVPGEWNEHACVALSPDGRLLASGNHDKADPLNESVHVRQPATGLEVDTFKGHRGEVFSVAFSPDGKKLATGSADGTMLIWDVAAAPAIAPRPETNLTDRELESAWENLAGADAARAYKATGKLVRASGQAVPFLRKHLRPAVAPDPRQLATLVANLDSDDFKIREKASAELANLAELAEPTLRKKLADTPSQEVRTRIGILLERLADLRRELTPRELRALRAVEVLEQAGTPEARQMLKELAGGAHDSHLTRDARAGLKRLASCADVHDSAACENTHDLGFRLLPRFLASRRIPWQSAVNDYWVRSPPGPPQTNPVTAP